MSAPFNWTNFVMQFKAFYAVNRKALNIAVIAVVGVTAISLTLKLWWLPKREKEAGAKLAKLHHYFQKDSFEVVLKGIKGKKMATAPQIADQYWLTEKGKEAALMAGEAYLQTGKFDKALDYLDKADADDIFLAPAILNAKASCYAELGKIEKAAKLYEEAGDLGKNDFCAQFYKNAGAHYELAKEYKDALRCYEKIKKQHSTTPEAGDIDKYIYRVKGLLGELN